MGGLALAISGDLQQLFLTDAICARHLRNGKLTLGQRAGLIESRDLRLGQQLQIVAALHQNTVMAGAANTGEEAQRHRDHQCTGAGNNQKCQRLVDKGRPAAPAQQRRDDSHQHSDTADCRRIHAGKAGDESLRLRLVVLRVLHHSHDAADGGIAEGPRDLDLQKATLVHTAGQRRTACRPLAGHGFTRQCGGIHRGVALDHLAVQRDTLTGAHQNDIAHGDRLRLDGGHFITLYQIGVVGPYIDQRLDGSAGGTHRLILKPFTDLIQQHNGNGLRILADAERADRRHRHQEVLVKDLTVGDVLNGLLQYGKTGQQIGDDAYCQLPCALQKENRCQQTHSGETHADIGQSALLLVPAVLMGVAMIVAAATAAAVAVGMLMVMFVFMFMLATVLMLTAIFVLVLVIAGHCYPSILSIICSNAIAKMWSMWSSSRE